MGPIPQPEEERDRPHHSMDQDIENEEHPDVIINVDLSDSDDEDDPDIGYYGYQAIPQDHGNMSDQSDEEVEDGPMEHSAPEFPTGDECEPGSGGDMGIAGVYADFPCVENLPNYLQAPDVPRSERHDLLWNQPRPLDVTMDTGHMEKIKSVMSGFQLPSSSIPDWARSISDDQWQFQVVNRLVKAETNPGNEVSSSIGTSQELAVSPDKGTSLKHSNSEEGEPV